MESLDVVISSFEIRCTREPRSVYINLLVMVSTRYSKWSTIFIAPHLLLSVATPQHSVAAEQTGATLIGTCHLTGAFR